MTRLYGAGRGPADAADRGSAASAGGRGQAVRRGRQDRRGYLWRGVPGALARAAAVLARRQDFQAWQGAYAGRAACERACWQRMLLQLSMVQTPDRWAFRCLSHW